MLAKLGFGGAESATAAASAVRTASASGSSACAPARGHARPAGDERAEDRRRDDAPPPSPAAGELARHAPSLPFRKASASVGRHVGRGGIATALVLELAGLQAAVGEDDAMRHADQLPVGEHRARALAAVVEDDVDAGAFERGVERVGGFAHGRRAVVADRADDDRERRDRLRARSCRARRGSARSRRRRCA